MPPSASNSQTQGPRLNAAALQPLPLGSLKPAGWLHTQLTTQRDGLSGQLDEFWPDVAQSRWIGGDAEGWERGPYWLDGVVPLAYLLDDERLKGKVEYWIDYILAHQHEDGWLGPEYSPGNDYPYDPWPLFILFKALTQYHDATGDARIPPALSRCLRKVATLLETSHLRAWARFRWADLLLSVHWLYDRTGEPWLLALGETLKTQGFDWQGHFAAFPFRTKLSPIECDLSSHGVNNAMGLKAPGVWYRHSGDPADRNAASQMIAVLDRYHGQATGMFSCDEHLAGSSPVQGSELCGVVEYMYSLETLLANLGEPELADRLETLAFNALPATMSPDMWSHQYDQQVNQVLCRHAEVWPRRAKAGDDTYPWTSNGPDANLFGLEPHFGCCTANMHQGWPKFAAHLWMRAADGGLAAVAYAPCTLVTDVEGIDVNLTVQTDYPFGGTLDIEVHTAAPVTFPLHLRIPGWAEGATVAVNQQGAQTAAPGTFFTVQHTWQGTTRLRLELPLHVRSEQRYNGSLSLYRGPLLFALKLGEDWRHLRGEPPHNDWEVHPTTAWNYALVPTPAEEIPVHVAEAVQQAPFSPDGAPVSATVTARRLPAWQLIQNSALPPPSPVDSSEPLEALTLIPYGCTNLRIAEFPILTDRPPVPEEAGPDREKSPDLREV